MSDSRDKYRDDRARDGLYRAALLVAFAVIAASSGQWSAALVTLAGAAIFICIWLARRRSKGQEDSGQGEGPH